MPWIMIVKKFSEAHIVYESIASPQFRILPYFVKVGIYKCSSDLTIDACLIKLKLVDNITYSSATILHQRCVKKLRLFFWFHLVFMFSFPYKWNQTFNTSPWNTFSSPKTFFKKSYLSYTYITIMYFYLLKTKTRTNPKVIPYGAIIYGILHVSTSRCERCSWLGQL